MSPADFPSNYQLSAHFPEFLAFGYKAGVGGPINVKFTHTGDRGLAPFSVGFVDGHCRILLMQSIIGFCYELGFKEKELQDGHLAMVLSSFASIHCCYEHYSNASHYFLASLRILAQIWFFKILLVLYCKFSLMLPEMESSFSELVFCFLFMFLPGVSKPKKWDTSLRRNRHQALSA